MHILAYTFITISVGVFILCLTHPLAVFPAFYFADPVSVTVWGHASLFITLSSSCLFTHSLPQNVHSSSDNLSQCSLSHCLQ